MALESNQPLTEISKGSRCVGLTTLPHSCVDGHEIWEPQTAGTLRASLGLYRKLLCYERVWSASFMNLQCRRTSCRWGSGLTVVLARSRRKIVTA